MSQVADARPTKRFFIENITGDLSLEDAILDLVDNAVDSYIRSREVDVSPAILRIPPRGEPAVEDRDDPLIAITFSEDMFEIKNWTSSIGPRIGRRLPS